MKVTELPAPVGRRPMGYFVRPMRAEDVDQVALVERECFPTGWIATPFRRELKNRMAAYLVACQARDPDPAEAEARSSLVRSDAAERQLPQGRWSVRLRGLLHRAPSLSTPPSHPIVGFLGMWFLVDEAHITAIGVRERHRRLGVGELLLLTGLELAVAREARVATLEVRASNRSAQALYAKYRFRQAGVRKGYYTDNREDALIMTTEPLSAPEYRDLLATLRREHAQRWGPSVRLMG